MTRWQMNKILKQINRTVCTAALVIALLFLIVTSPVYAIANPDAIDFGTGT